MGNNLRETVLIVVDREKINPETVSEQRNVS